MINDANGRITQIQALKNGQGLQYIINEAYKVLGNPLVLHNMEYELMCSAKGVDTDDPLWNELVTKGVFSDELIKFFLEECFIDDVANSKTIAFLRSDKLKYERLYGRVFNSYKNTVADLISVACDRPFEEEEDAAVFETICEKISQEISMSEYYKGYGIIYHEELICKLLDDDISDKVIYSGHLSNLYEDLKANLFVVVADISGYSADKNKLEEFRNLFKEMQPELKYAIYSKYIVIIASTDETVPNTNRDLYKLNRYFYDNNIRIGISSCFDNLYNLKKYYNEAVNSLE